MTTSSSRAAVDIALKGLTTDSVNPVLSVSAMAFRDGSLVYQNQFGWRALKQPARAQETQDLPVTDNTLFRIASISKLVVSLGVMRLVEQGLLELDRDVSDYLGWQLRNPWFASEAISTRSLLSHQSSLTDGDGVYWWDVPITLADVLQPGGSVFRDGLFWNKRKAPNRWFQYCNLNFGVIATVMEAVTKERFDRLMNRLVFAPLEIEASFNPLDFTAEQLNRVAIQYRKRATINNREIWNPQGPWVVQADDFQAERPTEPVNLAQYKIGTNGTLFGPQGRLRIGMRGLGRIMEMFLAAGSIQRSNGSKIRFLSAQSIKDMQSEQWSYNPTHPNGDTMGDGTLSWGLGVQRFTDRGKDRFVEEGGLKGFGHFGDAYGLMATFVVDPDQRRGQILVITGPGNNPDNFPSRYSTMYRWEEIGNSALFSLIR